MLCPLSVLFITTLLTTLLMPATAHDSMPQEAAGPQIPLLWINSQTQGILGHLCCLSTANQSVHLQMTAAGLQRAPLPSAPAPSEIWATCFLAHRDAGLQDRKLEEMPLLLSGSTGLAVQGSRACRPHQPMCGTRPREFLESEVE